MVFKIFLYFIYIQYFVISASYIPYIPFSFSMITISQCICILFCFLSLLLLLLQKSFRMRILENQFAKLFSILNLLTKTSKLMTRRWVWGIFIPKVVNHNNNWPRDVGMAKFSLCPRQKSSFFFWVLWVKCFQDK